MKDEFIRNQSAEVVQVWDRVAGIYNLEALSGPDYQTFIGYLLENAGEPTGRSYCEVGCGSGIFSAVLAGLGAQATLVDISPKSLGFAVKYFQQLGLPGSFCLQNGLAMGFADQCFDVAWNGGVLEHFDDDGKVALLREMWRIVKPGGVIFLAVPNCWDLPFMAGKWLAIKRGTWDFGFEEDFSAAKFRELAAAAGIVRAQVFAYNPIVGWWFLPFGKTVTQKLGLNTENWHRKKNWLGHFLLLIAHKEE